MSSPPRYRLTHFPFKGRMVPWHQWTSTLKINPHTDLGGIEATPLPMGEGPGVRRNKRHFHLPVASHRGMITLKEKS